MNQTNRIVKEKFIHIFVTRTGNMNISRKISFLCIAAAFFVSTKCYAITYRDTVRISTVTQALSYLKSIKKLEKSRFWPNVEPEKLLENLKTFTIEPLDFYEGKATNFCAYSALTYLPLEYDPLGFSKFMVSLYKYGQARMGKTIFKPSKAVREEAGIIKYKGALDINPAGQMWFLSLADEFKGYLNFFNKRFQPGDENSFWASTNYAKFNRMLRTLFPVKLRAKGSDLIKPAVENLYEYLDAELKKGILFVYLNNKKLYKKTHTNGFISTPTHYIMLVNIEKSPDGNIEFIYWDYGRKSLQQLSPAFLKNIVYGITTTTFKRQR